jgi:hypothetical protein
LPRVTDLAWRATPSSKPDREVPRRSLELRQNDPRGELISVETKLETSPDDVGLRDRAKALHDEHDKTCSPS